MSANLDIESRYDEDAALSIGDVVAATGVGEATLRAWGAPLRLPLAAAGEPKIGERARAYLDRISDWSQRSQLRLAGAITARAFARMP
jgi:hypothetical protein